MKSLKISKIDFKAHNDAYPFSVTDYNHIGGSETTSCIKYHLKYCKMQETEEAVRMLVDMIKHNESVTFEQAEEMIELVSKAFPDFVKI